MSFSKEEIESVPKLCDAATFPMWEMEMKILFAAQQLDVIVDGTSTKESCGEDSKKILDWNTKDARAKYLILRTVSNSAKSHLLVHTTSKDMFDALCKVYKRDSLQTKDQLLTELFTFSYDKNVDVMGNISRLQTIAFRLNTVAPNTVDDDMMITKILVSLPDQFKNFSTAWDSTTNSEKTLDNLKARLLKEEEKLKTKEDVKVAFKTGPKKNFNSKMTCYNCGKTRPSYEGL